MSRRGRNEAPVGKGIDAAAIQKVGAAGGPFITVHEINENAWKAFYASPEGKARLNRMKDLNQLKMARYQGIANGTAKYVSGASQRDSEVYKTWKRTRFADDGSILSRGGNDIVATEQRLAAARQAAAARRAQQLGNPLGEALAEVRGINIQQ